MQVVLLGGLILSGILYYKKDNNKITQQGGNIKIKETLYRVAPSKLGGVGLFAIGDIPQNTKILQDRIKPTGKFYSKEELKNFNSNFVKTMQDYWCLGHNNKTFIPDNPHIISPVNFINHSDKPNVKHMGEYFITLNDIKEGDEILESYHQVCNGKHIMFNN